MKKKSFAKIYESRVTYNEDCFSNTREYLSTEPCEFEGKIINQSTYKVDDPCHRYDGLDASDFALENQVAVGVVMNPVKCSFGAGVVDSFIRNSLKSE